MSDGDISPRVILALDFPDRDSAMRLVRQLTPEDCRLKVGKELFTRCGPELVRDLVKLGFDVFLDLKFHDIPNTVAAACAAAADLGVWMLNLHASGGLRMMETAAERLAGLSNPPLLIAVTILTSLDETDLRAVGFSADPSENVLRLAHLTRDAGLDGVVCSPRETAAIRERIPEPGFHLVTPGVRPQGVTLNDQKRVMTPADALHAGASYLVIGRPVTAAAEPALALRRINAGLPG